MPLQPVQVAQLAVGPADPAARAPDPPFDGLTIFVDTDAPNAADGNPGTTDQPVRTVQRAVDLADDANARGQAVRVLLGSGVYRESVGLTFDGERTDAAMIIEGSPGAVLSGADLWGGWEAQPDGSYISAWPYDFGMLPIPEGWENYWNEDGNGRRRDILRRSELVFADGVPLHGVLSLRELAPGTFFVNEREQRLHVRLLDGRSMAGTTMEVTVRQPVLLVDGRSNLTIRHLTVEKGRGGVLQAAFVIRNSRDVTVSDVLVQLNTYNGLGTNNNEGIVITGSRFNDNGVVGLSGYREQDILLEDSEIARNNWRGWPTGHEEWDSVFKWLSVHDALARRLRIIDNFGNGFWLDSDNRDVELRESLISGNRKGGVTLEGNQGPILVTANRICGNVQAGVLDAQSDRVTLQGNHIFGNMEYNFYFSGDQSGQTATDWETDEETFVNTRYWAIQDNVIAGNGDQEWLWWNAGREGVWDDSRDTLLGFNNNIWYHTRDEAYRLPDGRLGYAAFRTELQRSDPNHESGSVWSNPGSLPCR
ncbi:MAG: right-handed parallel beta-helix repeat-containing protein [Egibacteraceae bacterium]